MKNIEKISAAAFPTAVRNGVVLVDFFAQWHGQCHKQYDVLNALASHCIHRLLTNRVFRLISFITAPPARKRKGGFLQNNATKAKKTARRKPCCASDLQIREVTIYPYRQGKERYKQIVTFSVIISSCNSIYIKQSIFQEPGQKKYIFLPLHCT